MRIEIIENDDVINVKIEGEFDTAAATEFDEQFHELIFYL